jgi:DNA polymerase III subunit gamma/tau
MKTNTLLYNKFRPIRFDEVGGNDQITELLKNMVANKEIANSHFIFSGSPGTGKTTSAKILARAVNCLNLHPDGEPCNQCKRCVLFLDGKYSDYLELDGTQYNKVEDAKRLVDLASQYPITPGGYRIILIDEAHALSNQAFDKFLILLESADVKTIFIFSTTDIHLFRPAIVSRCFSFTITPMNAKQISGELLRICKAEKMEYKIEAINKLAYQFTGKPRDAIKTLDMHYRAYGKFVKYEDNSQETLMLELLKKAYFNKIEEYQDTLDKLDPSYVFRTLARTLNEVFFFPTLQPVLLKAEEVEAFKTLVDITSLKQLIRDASIFKPNDPYSLSLFLTQVSEIGLKLSSKAQARSATVGRRFISEDAPKNKIVTLDKNPDNDPSVVVDLDDDIGIDLDEPAPLKSKQETVVETPENMNQDLLSQYGFNKKQVSDEI